MKKILLVMMVLVCAFALAQPSMYYKKGSVIDLKIACSSNGASCSNADCNVSVAYPNTSLLVDNKVMSKSGLFYNYTLPESKVIGEYQAVVSCLDSVGNATTAYAFEITNNGFFNNDYTIILAIGIIAGLIFLFVFKVTDKHLQFLLMVFGILFALLIPAYFMMRDALSIFYYIFSGLIVVLAAYMLIYLSKYVLEKAGLYVPREGRR